MIYLTDKMGRDIYCGHVGCPIPEDVSKKVEYAQVDGHELEFACALLGRPMPPTRVFTFCGSSARTIALNFK